MRRSERAPTLPTLFLNINASTKMFLVMSTYVCTFEFKHAFVIKYTSCFCTFYLVLTNTASELQLTTLTNEARASLFTGYRRGGRPRDSDDVSEAGAPGAERLWQRDAPHVSQLQLRRSQAPQTATAVLRGRG